MSTKTIIAVSYVTVWAVLFFMGILFGAILKKDVLGNGVKCGIVNSFLLSAVWPLTILCGLAGWMYDLWQGWKKL